MKQVAFLTLDQRGDFVIDDELAVQPLAELGCKVSIVSWRQTQVPWSQFDGVVIRSTWDYWNDVNGFLEVLQVIDGATRLANPLKLVHWNLAKTYLREMEENGVKIVQTLWPETLDTTIMKSCFDRLGSDEIVVKPVVGANGEDTFRLERGSDRDKKDDIARLFHQRPAMVQRFMPTILTEGEYSLFYFNGSFSHAILKVPAQGEFRSQEERGAEIRSVRPEQKLLQSGERALAIVNPAPLYARIDMVRNGTEDFAVMELELIEPSLYLRTDPGAPARFARAVNDWCSGPSGQSLTAISDSQNTFWEV